MRNFPCRTRDGNLSGRDLNDARIRNLVYVHHREALPGYAESAATNLPLILRARPKSDATIEPGGMVVEGFHRVGNRADTRTQRKKADEIAQAMYCLADRWSPAARNCASVGSASAAL